MEARLFLDISVALPSREWEENYFEVYRHSLPLSVLTPSYDVSDFFSEDRLREVQTRNHMMYRSRAISATAYSHLLVLENIMRFYSALPRLTGRELLDFVKKLVTASFNEVEESELNRIIQTSDSSHKKFESMQLLTLRAVFGSAGNEWFFDQYEAKIERLTDEHDEMYAPVVSTEYRKPDLVKVVQILARGVRHPGFMKQLVEYAHCAFEEQLQVLLDDTADYEGWLLNIGELYPYLLLPKFFNLEEHRQHFTDDEWRRLCNQEKAASECYANLISTIGLIGIGVTEPSFAVYIADLNGERDLLAREKRLIFDYRNKLTIPKYLYDQLSTRSAGVTNERKSQTRRKTDSDASREMYAKVLQSFAFGSSQWMAEELLALAITTDEAYYAALDQLREEFALETFGPWDSQYVVHQCTLRIDELCPSVFSRERLEGVLRESLRRVGFSREAEALRWFDACHTPPDTVVQRGKRQIWIRNRSDSGEDPLGECRDCYHWFRGVDVKVNLVEDSFETYRLLFRQVGHALHFINIDCKYPSMRLKMPRFFKDGVAQVFEQLTVDDDWLSEHFGLDQRSRERVRYFQGLAELVTIRENLVRALYELATYNTEDPFGERSDAFHGFWTRFASAVTYPGAGELPTNLLLGQYSEKWVLDPFSAFHVVHSTLIREHVRKHLVSHSNGVFYADWGEELRKIYQPGGSIDWRDSLRETTGRIPDATLLSTYYEGIFVQ